MIQANTIAACGWLLCLFAALAMPVHATQRRTDGIALLAGFFVAVSIALWWSPATSGIALLIGCASAWQLLRPTPSVLSSTAAGAIAGCGAALHVNLGAPLPIAALLALSIAGAAWLRTQSHPEFAPPALRRQALTGLTLVSPLIAATPAISEGWQSALALNRTLENGATLAMPAWVWQFAVFTVVTGILHGLVVRR